MISVLFVCLFVLDCFAYLYVCVSVLFPLEKLSDVRSLCFLLKNNSQHSFLLPFWGRSGQRVADNYFFGLDMLCIIFVVFWYSCVFSLYACVPCVLSCVLVAVLLLKVCHVLCIVCLFVFV